ncbi:MAG TPA: MaoC/PaaZ C-terminal domain-containing protein [Casimicrobiaceae bacterium]
MSEVAGLDELAIGDDIAAFTAPPLTRLQLALFAGAAADPNPIHVDDAAAKRGGLPGVIAHGMLGMALLGRLLTQLVPQRRIRSFSARFVAVALPGDIITCTGTVAGRAREDGEERVELDLAARNQRGEKLLVGKASIALA